MNTDNLDWLVEFPVETDEWGLYKGRWGKQDVDDETFRHPAKYSRKLIRWIYKHAIEQGWIARDSVVLDPFGGVALGALDAMSFGVKWVGIELEPQWVEIGRRNLALWEKKWHLKGATLLQGDSRKLIEILKSNTGGSITSPPYSETRIEGKGDEGASQLKMPDGSFPRGAEGWELRKQLGERYAANSGNNLGNMPDGDFDASIASSPYAETGLGFGRNGLLENGEVSYKRPYMDGGNEYGGESGQLGNFKDVYFKASLCSPPFRQEQGGTNVTSTEGPLSDPALIERHRAGNASTHGYGETEGNLANMEDGSIDSVISSSPYKKTIADGGWQMLGKYAQEGRLTVDQVNGDPTKLYPSWNPDRKLDYGNTEGQMANMENGDFGASISSSPFHDTLNDGFEERKKNYANTQAFGRSIGGDYGKTDGQMSKMTDEGFNAVTASPAYSGNGLGHKGDPSEIDKEKHLYSRMQDNSYGATPGQLGELSDNNFNALASSPAYGETAQSGGTNGLKQHGTGLTQGEACFAEYGQEEGQLGRMPVDTPKEKESFWFAARQIIEQVYQVLKPGSVSIWILKRYIKDKQIVEFPMMWAKLCVACGFEPVSWHRCWMVKPGAKYQDLILGDTHDTTSKTTSFFRRLYEKKYPHNRIDWEDVMVLRKPL